MMEHRTVNFAHSTVLIEYNGARATFLVEFLFHDIPANDAIPPRVTFRLAPVYQSDALVLSRDGKPILESILDAELAEVLLGEVTYHLAETSWGGLAFHAGALATQGRGVLMPGAVGAGKTTLTAWLVTQGLDYLTDEITWVPEGTATLHALTRPLNFKSSARTVLQSFFDFEKNALAILSSARFDLIPPTVLRPNNAPCAPHLALILFPHYQPDSEVQIQPMSKAQTGLALLECLVNARNLPEQGFPETARLAQIAPAYRLRYNQFDQIAGHIHNLLQTD